MKASSLTSDRPLGRKVLRVVELAAADDVALDLPAHALGHFDDLGVAVGVGECRHFKLLVVETITRRRLAGSRTRGPLPARRRFGAERSRHGRQSGQRWYPPCIRGSRLCRRLLYARQAAAPRRRAPARQRLRDAFTQPGVVRALRPAGDALAEQPLCQRRLVAAQGRFQPGQVQQVALRAAAAAAAHQPLLRLQVSCGEPVVPRPNATKASHTGSAASYTAACRSGARARSPRSASSRRRALGPALAWRRRRAWRARR